MIRVIIWSRIVYVTFNGRCGIFDKLWSARIAITKVTFWKFRYGCNWFLFQFPNWAVAGVLLPK